MQSLQTQLRCHSQGILVFVESESFFVEIDKVILRHQDWSVATVDMFSEDPEDDQSLENSCSGSIDRSSSSTQSIFNATV